MANTDVMTGTYGEIKVGAAIDVAYIGNWSIQKTCNVTRYSSSRVPGKMRAKPGTTGWTGSFKFDVDAAADLHFKEGMYVEDCIFHADDSGSNSATGDIIIENVDLEVDVEGDAIVGGTCTFVGDGTLTEAGALAVDEQLSSS